MSDTSIKKQSNNEGDNNKTHCRGENKNVEPTTPFWNNLHNARSKSNDLIAK